MANKKVQDMAKTKETKGTVVYGAIPADAEHDIPVVYVRKSRWGGGSHPTHIRLTIEDND